ncbi:MAG: NAD(P)/FAD-dependent oxidoreductase, partial [Desulfuromonadales bacterium]|nr:NAD(P)/FAD-dependent oxidoreductase [Desulfuromonadales bacterium]
MTSALILAQKGLRVALVEKSPRLAPLMRGFSRREIFFDTGFHYSGCLADGEALDTFLRYLGLADRLEKRPYARDGFDIVRSRNPQWEFRFPWGEDDVRQKLHERFPAETLAIDSYLDTVFRVCDTT